MGKNSKVIKNFKTGKLQATFENCCLLCLGNGL